MLIEENEACELVRDAQVMARFSYCVVRDHHGAPSACRPCRNLNNCAIKGYRFSYRVNLLSFTMTDASIQNLYRVECRF